MDLPDWLRPPRHLLVLFLLVTLVPAATLVWLGWQFVERDRAFERQQLQDRLEAGADRIGAGIRRNLEAMSREMPAWIDRLPAAWASNSVLVRLTSSGENVITGTSLPFVPSTSPEQVPLFSPRLAEAEALEFRRHDFAAAVGAFQTLSASADSETRTAALIGLARNLRALGRREEALVAYQQIQRVVSARILDEPAELVALAAEADVLHELGRSSELAPVAQTLAEGLRQGRWAIDRATFEMRVAQVAAWTEVGVNAEAIARATAIATVWSERAAEPFAPSNSGWRNLRVDGIDTLVGWREHDSGTLLFATVADSALAEWKSAWADDQFAASVVVRGTNESASVPPDATAITYLHAAESGLPWDLRITDTAHVARASSFSTRRQLLLWGLALLVVLIPAGGYTVWRSVSRELEVAQLQADFVSAVSHEFRTPLTSMAHLTERLQRDSNIAEDRKRQYYDVLARDTDRLQRFVETLLDFGRMEAGSGLHRPETVDLTTVVSAVLREFNDDEPTGRREIAFESDAALPPVRIDREAFGRALWNLLDNASKYSPADAPITVRLRRRGREAHVEVVDRGPGIPEAERRLIFQKFVRGTDSKTAGIRGTGVGLAMVERILRAHRGWVTLESVVGQGSTFSLVLPLEDSAA